jgi:hypothetical protein
MALAKHHEEIILRRSDHGARIVYEYQHPQGATKRGADPDQLRSAGRSGDRPELTPEKWVALKATIDRMINECNERLAREMTAVFKLNEQKTKLSKVGFVTKSEAAAVTGVHERELLELDSVYGGTFVRSGHLFISEIAFVNGVRTYGTDLAPSVFIDAVMKDSRERRQKLWGELH